MVGDRRLTLCDEPAGALDSERAQGVPARDPQQRAQRAHRPASSSISADGEAPVFAATFADVLGRSAQPDRNEVTARHLGTAQYVLEVQAPIGSGFAQAPIRPRG